jgi:hypothetical protein
LLRNIKVEINRMLTLGSPSRVSGQLSKRADDIGHASTIGDSMMTIYTQQESSHDETGMHLKDWHPLTIFYQLVSQVKRRINEGLGREALRLKLRICPPERLPLIKD